MKAILAVLALVSFSLTFNGRVAAQMGHECQHDMTTVASLHQCVQHASEMGHIDNVGVAQSLLAKIDAAQAAVDNRRWLSTNSKH